MGEVSERLHTPLRQGRHGVCLGRFVVFVWVGRFVVFVWVGRLLIAEIRSKAAAFCAVAMLCKGLSKHIVGLTKGERV